MQSTISLRGLFARGQFALYTAIAEKAAYFAVFMCLARMSSVGEYGIITAVFAFLNILASFFELGIAPYFQRETAARKPDLEQKLHAALGMRLFLLLPFFGIAFLYFWASGTANADLVLFISLIVYLGSIGGIFSRVLYGQNRYSAAFKALAVSKVGVILGAGICFVLQTPPHYLLAVLLGGVLLQVLFMAAELKSSAIQIRAAFSAHVMRSILASSLPMGVGLSFVWIYDKVDILLIRQILGSDAVSYYAVAYSLYKIPQVAAGVIIFPLFTDASARFATTGRIVLADLLKPAGVLLGISAAAIIVYHAIPGMLLELIYGPSYRASGWILSGLSFALPGLLMNNLTGITLNAIKRERLGMISAMMAFSANIAANFFLLPGIGLLGAVIATICAEYLVLIIQLVFLHNSERFQWRKTILPTTTRG